MYSMYSIPTALSAHASVVDRIYYHHKYLFNVPIFSTDSNYNFYSMFFPLVIYLLLLLPSVIKMHFPA